MINLKVTASVSHEWGDGSAQLDKDLSFDEMQIVSVSCVASVISVASGTVHLENSIRFDRRVTQHCPHLFLVDFFFLSKEKF